jgi:Icc protein
MQEQIRYPRDRTLLVLQISDTHLYEDPAGRLLGLNTQASLEHTLELAQAVHWPPDLVLATGDLVHDGSAAGYARLHERLTALGVPVYCLPGNHDNQTQLSASLNGNTIRWVTSSSHGAWAIEFVDSNRPGSAAGHIRERELARLRESLGRRTEDHILVCLHHQPVPIGSAWLDSMAIDNAAALFEILDRTPQVKGVLWGHVHQVYEAVRKGVRLLSCPSTCIQFLPQSKHFDLDTQPPGYRWLQLHPDGRIDTGIKRLEYYPNAPDIDAPGY